VATHGGVRACVCSVHESRALLQNLPRRMVGNCAIKLKLHGL